MVYLASEATIRHEMAGVHQPPSPPVLFAFQDTDALVKSLADFIIKIQKDSITKKGRFTIALSGGSLPKMLRGLITEPSVKWDKWYILYYIQVFLLNSMSHTGTHIMSTSVSFRLIILTPITAPAWNTSFQRFPFPKKTYTP
jgi:hypothetical protein